MQSRYENSDYENLLPLWFYIINQINNNTFVQVTESKCHNSMVVNNKNMSNPPKLNISSLSPAVRDACNAKNSNPVFWFSVPRKNVVKYCKDFQDAKTKMEEMLEVRPMSNPKSTWLLYMTASNQACKSPSKITSSTVVQQSVIVVGTKSRDLVVNCPAKDDLCYLYKLQKDSNTNKSQGRRLAQSSRGEDAFFPSHQRKLQCTANNEHCVYPEDCCSMRCDRSKQPWSCSCLADGFVCNHDYDCCSSHGCDFAQGTCGCFPASSTVTLADGSTKTMASLRIGDKVLSVDENTGNLVYSEVYTFFESDRSNVNTYLTLKLGRMDVTGRCLGETTPPNVVSQSTWELHVTHNHAVYRSREGSTSLSDAELIHAGKVVVGDVMWAVETSKDATATAACVIGVEKQLEVGTFAPHTLAGSIVVDGVVAHSVADLTLSGKFMSDVAGLPLSWYTKGTAHLRLLYRLGLLPKGDASVGVLQSLPIPVIHAIAGFKSFFK